MSRVAVIIVAVAAFFSAVTSGASWLDDGILAGWGKGDLSKTEAYCYEQRIRRIVGFWQDSAYWKTLWLSKGMLEQPNDIFLVIDTEKPAVWVEYKGHVVE